MYFNLSQKESILSSFNDKVSETLSSLMSIYFIKDHIAGGLTESIRMDVKNIDDVVRMNIPSEVQIAGLRYRISLVAGGVSLTAKNGVNSDVEFVYKKRLILRTGDTNDSVFEELAEWIFSIYNSLVVNVMQRHNLNGLNEVLADIVKQAGLGYSVSFTSTMGNEGKCISALSDDDIVLVVDDSAVFRIGDMVIMQEPSAIVSEEDIANARKDVAEKFATAHTTLEFLNSKFDVIRFLCNTKKSVITHIKNITHRNIDNQVRTVNCVVYYLKDDVFALAELVDGKFETLLSPFNVKTFEKVDGVNIEEMYNK